MTESKSIQGSRAGDTSETSMQKEIQVIRVMTDYYEHELSIT